MQKLRVLRVIARLNIGGPAIQAITLSKRLDPSRFETVLATGRCAPGEEEMSSLLAREGVEPVRIPGLGRALHPAEDARAFAGLLGLIRRFRPHILHTHTAKAGALGRTAGALLGVPVRVHTFHGHVFRGYFSPAKSRAAVLTERGLGLLSHQIVSISEAQRRDLVDEFKIAPAEKVTVIPLGFALEPLLAVARGEVPGTLRAELGAASTDCVVGIVGRVAPIKNHSLFLTALARALSQEPRLRGVVIGDGPAPLMAQLRAQAEQLGIAARVHFLGYRTELASLYADLDVVALSSDNEGTPVALIEALAAGRACVSTRVGGVPDVLGDGRFGRLTPPGDADALASALVALARDEAGRAAARALGPAAAEERYGFTRLRRDIESLYTRLWADR